MTGDSLVSFWLAVALVIVTLVGAFGWLVALSLARDGAAQDQQLRDARTRRGKQEWRLHELRHLNHRLVSRVRDAEPKSASVLPSAMLFQPKHIAGCVDPNCRQTCRKVTP